MGAEIKDKSKRLGFATCDTCGKTSKVVQYASSAAPELTILEALEPEGWAYTIGFWAMLAGHQVMCPNCCVKRDIPKGESDGTGM